MNAALMLAFWRQRLTSPIRAVLLGALFGLPLLAAAFMRGAGLSVLGDSTGLVMVFAVGMLGQDVSSGVLQLLFARPVRRPTYVMSRWLAVGAAASAVGLAQLVVAAALMAAHGAAPSLHDVALFAGQRVLESFGLAAVFALLSSLIGGVGDIALYFLGTIVCGVFQLVGGAKGWPAITRLGTELLGFLTPKLDVGQLVTASPLPLFPIASFLSTVTLCLVLAIVVMNRKELSYASG